MSDVSVQQIIRPLFLTTGMFIATEIKTYFNFTWEQYESLFDILASEEGFYERPQPLRHPLIFYFGHTATFFVNKLVLGNCFLNELILVLSRCLRSG